MTGSTSTCTATTLRPRRQATRRFWIRTYGCQMNHHDSELFGGLFDDLGYQAVDDPADADVILVNTCSVREKAEDKLFSELGRLRRFKAGGRNVPRDLFRQGDPGIDPDAVYIGVAGCIAQQRGEEIVEREPSVDFVIGTRAIRSLPEVLGELESGRRPQVRTDDQVDFEPATPVRKDEVKGFVTIMEGCDNYCSFCIVPETRGFETYRPADRILDEVRGLAIRGYREVTLLGQNVNSWEDPDSSDGFPELLVRLDSMLTERDGDGVERIRFLTSHPKDLSDDLIDAMATCRHVAPHLHLPVQSGSERILRLMNRHYSVERYLRLVEKLRAAVPGVGLSTDIIVGFPGESRDDFEATLGLVRDVEYDSFYSFEYSPRPGTAALRYDDDVDAEEKRRRLVELQETQRRIQSRKNSAWVGRIAEVLVDGISVRSDDDVTGRTGSNQIVNFPGDPGLIGRFVDVRITDSGDNSLYGERVEAGS